MEGIKAPNEDTQLLRIYKTLKGLTLKQLAGMFGVSYGFIAKVSAGFVKVPKRISELIRKDVEDFCEDFLKKK